MTMPDTYAYQCPLCKAWQMEYSLKVMLKEFGAFTIDRVTHEIRPNPKPMHDAIEDVLLEHLQEVHPTVVAVWRTTGKLVES